MIFAKLIITIMNSSELDEGDAKVVANLLMGTFNIEPKLATQDKIMTKVSIETIGGKLRTVIRKPFDADWVKEQLDMGIPVMCNCGGIRKTLTTLETIVTTVGDTDVTLEAFVESGYFGESFLSDEIESIVTILPALPKHPKPEDAPLLYRYLAEGLRFVGSVHEEHWRNGKRDGVSVLKDMKIYLFGNALMYCNYGKMRTITRAEITHAILNYERVEIAIKGERK